MARSINIRYDVALYISSRNTINFHKATRALSIERCSINTVNSVRCKNRKKVRQQPPPTRRVSSTSSSSSEPRHIVSGQRRRRPGVCIPPRPAQSRGRLTLAGRPPRLPASCRVVSAHPRGRRGWPTVSAVQKCHRTGPDCGQGPWVT
jgi:hypothetical protein